MEGCILKVICLFSEGRDKDIDDVRKSHFLVFSKVFSRKEHHIQPSLQNKNIQAYTVGFNKSYSYGRIQKYNF